MNLNIVCSLCEKPVTLMLKLQNTSGNEEYPQNLNHIEKAIVDKFDWVAQEGLTFFSFLEIANKCLIQSPTKRDMNQISSVVRKLSNRVPSKSNGKRGFRLKAIPTKGGCKNELEP